MVRSIHYLKKMLNGYLPEYCLLALNMAKCFISEYINGIFAGYMSVFARYILVFAVVLGSAISVKGQVNWPTPEVENLYKQAREYHSKGNLRQAIVMYQQAIQIAPDIVLLYRELAYAYYLARGYDEAIATLQPIIDQGKGDDMVHLIMTQSLLGKGELKKAKKFLRSSVEKFPNSGILFHEMGLMYEGDDEKVYALETWLEGIRKDPTYHVNYYEAARMYMSSNKIVWAILYAEMFINIEQQTNRSLEARKMLLEAYGKLFSTVSTADVPKFGSSVKANSPESFEEAVYNTYIHLAPVVADGITTENLVMLRTRFMMDWTMQYAERYPFSLFTRMDDMLRNGYFDIYNEWMFGKVENLQQYDAWVKFHQDALPWLEQWLSRHPYRPENTDFYNERTVDGIFTKRKG